MFPCSFLYIIYNEYIIIQELDALLCIQGRNYISLSVNGVQLMLRTLYERDLIINYNYLYVYTYLFIYIYVHVYSIYICIINNAKYYALLNKIYKILIKHI